MSVPPENVREEAVIALDEVRRKRTGEQGVLGGTEDTVFREKVVAEDRKRDLLPFKIRAESIVSTVRSLNVT
ncbi:MAG: hypothetical protein IKH74_04835 [Lachnospiraceae bacterium]|nr:hypothetical protein [Lachnospiraceae bacterium]